MKNKFIVRIMTVVLVLFIAWMNLTNNIVRGTHVVDGKTTYSCMVYGSEADTEFCTFVFGR